MERRRSRHTSSSTRPELFIFSPIRPLARPRSYAVPVFDGRVVRDAARRINLGGKALTNYLKEVVSYRSMNMMDEFVLMERIKEQLCYVVSGGVPRQRGRSGRAESREPRAFAAAESSRFPPAPQAKDLRSEIVEAKKPRARAAPLMPSAIAFKRAWKTSEPRCAVCVCRCAARSQRTR